MEFILQSASSITFYVFSFLMLEKLYQRKKLQTWTAVLIITVAAACMAIIGIFQIPELNYAYSLCSLLVIHKILYQCKGKMFIIIDIILLITMLAMEMLSVLLMSVIFAIKVSDVLSNFWYQAASIIIWCILMFLTFRVYQFFVPSNNVPRVRMMEMLFFLILTSGELFFLHYINAFLLQSSAHYEIAIILVLFLGADLYFAYLIHGIAKAYELENELKLAKQQSQIQLNGYRDLIKKYDSSRKIVHDARKHINALEGLVKGDYIDSAENYIGMLNLELDKLSPRFLCDSPILTVIINDKLEEAENSDIRFDLDILYSDLRFMTELDITAIFANLLDNAFEACATLDEQKRSVKLIITRYNDFLIINLSNAYEEVNQTEDQDFISTKEGHRGIGLTNIRNAVEKYEGIIEFITNNERFISKITVPIFQN